MSMSVLISIAVCVHIPRRHTVGVCGKALPTMFSFQSTKPSTEHKGMQRSMQLLPMAAHVNDDELLFTALSIASDTGSLFDTKFYAYSRRRKNGVVYEPKAIHANSWLLRKKLPYFEQCEWITFLSCIPGTHADEMPCHCQCYRMHLAIVSSAMSMTDSPQTRTLSLKTTNTVRIVILKMTGIWMSMQVLTKCPRAQPLLAMLGGRWASLQVRTGTASVSRYPSHITQSV